MEELPPDEKKVYEAMKRLGATNPNSLKTADDIARTANLPKGRVTNALTSMVGKGIAKRVAREKAAGYYLLK